MGALTHLGLSSDGDSAGPSRNIVSLNLMSPQQAQVTKPPPCVLTQFPISGELPGHPGEKGKQSKGFHPRESSELEAKQGEGPFLVSKLVRNQEGAEHTGLGSHLTFTQKLLRLF